MTPAIALAHNRLLIEPTDHPMCNGYRTSAPLGKENSTNGCITPIVSGADRKPID